MIKLYNREKRKLNKIKNYKVFDPENKIYYWLLSTGKIEKPHPKKDEFLERAKKLHCNDLKEELKRASEQHKPVIRNHILNFNSVINGKPVMKKKYNNIVMDLILTNYILNDEN
jgi:hypothetical protein